MKRLLSVLCHAIFWIWNLTFLTVVYAGILPTVGAALVTDGFIGAVPADLLVTLGGLVAVPTTCTLIGWFYFRKQPFQLMRLLYGVEAPLFLLCLLRLFLLREMTLATGQIVGTIGVCVFVFLVDLLHGYAARHRPLAWMQLVGHSFMVWVGLFVGALFAFYAIPVGWLLIQEFFKFNWVGSLFSMIVQDPLVGLWWLPISFLLFGFTGALFVIMPFALATFYVQSWRRILLAFAAQQGRLRTWIGTVTTVTVWMVAFLVLQQQPQIYAFSALATPPQTDTNRQALLAQSDRIRAGLVNAYLLSYRYLSTKQENNHIQAMYQEIFGLPEPAAQFLQARYNQLMSPFLYDGDRQDAEKAGKLYAEFFDVPIQKAERDAIQHALQSTYDRSEAKAGLLSINQANVWLAQQRLTVKPQGDWAEVELYEVYENKTAELQEVFYSFSLPESAVITGLWLGDTDKLDSRFVYTVSPRGAAQQVYTQQVRQSVDPALIEQVGPRHYRLRAFPVPVQTTKQERLHLWLTYKVLQQEAGWPLPQLGEKRNAFWTDKTKRILNGKVETWPQSDWLPASLPANQSYRPVLHEAVFTDNYQLTAKPLTQKDYALPKAKRFAIVLDGSRSMSAHRGELAETVSWFQKQVLANNKADLYITAAAGAQPRRIDDLRQFAAAKMTFYGTIQLKQMLQQFDQLRGQTAYDAILLVTDEGSYELSDDSKSLPALAAPLWMVHLGGQLPPAYDDTVLKAIQDGGGGVAIQPQEVLQRLATKAALGPKTVNVMDGYAWLMAKTEKPARPKQGFDSIAARQLILGLSQERTQEQLTQLDAMHAIAKTYDIVTPYSSMIVLVNDQQREELKKAEANKDRFEREVESGQEQLSQPLQPFNVSGVPEPEEWMLLGMVAIALVLLVRYQRRTNKAKTN